MMDFENNSNFRKCCRLEGSQPPSLVNLPQVTVPASQTSVSILNLLMLLLLSLTTVAQLLNRLGCCGGGNDSGGSSSSASSSWQLSADSKSIRSDVESPPDGYLTMCWPAVKRGRVVIARAGESMDYFFQLRGHGPSDG